MSEPFVAEIRIFGSNYPPRGWAFCNGQLLPISQNTALFSLLGTTYGGNGQSTFALPNVQGRAAMAPGQGQGLSNRLLGESAGQAFTTLLESEIPAHDHGLLASPDPADLGAPGANRALARSQPNVYKQPAGASTPQLLAAQAVGATGGSQPHNNLMPYLALNFCIALQGVFPPRS